MIVLLGTKILQNAFGIIFRMGHKKVPELLAPIAILERSTDARLTKILSRKAPLDKQKKHDTNRVAKLISVTAETESSVVVVTSKWGLMTIKIIQKSCRNKIYSPCELLMRGAQTSRI